VAALRPVPTSNLFGGNSNWRGPIWFPINYLLIETLRVYHRYLGDAFAVEFPTGSGRQLPLSDIADRLAGRLTGIFLERGDGTRPVFGAYELLQRDPAWRGLIPFHEYFHGDTGAGLGASHQTGWTGPRRRPHHPARPRLRATAQRTGAPLARTTSQRPPNSDTFWHRIWPALRSPT
jgi:hypothetical protein